MVHTTQATDGGGSSSRGGGGRPGTEQRGDAIRRWGKALERSSCGGAGIELRYDEEQHMMSNSHTQPHGPQAHQPLRSRGPMPFVFERRVSDGAASMTIEAFDVVIADARSMAYVDGGDDVAVDVVVAVCAIV